MTKKRPRRKQAAAGGRFDRRLRFSPRSKKSPRPGRDQGEFLDEVLLVFDLRRKRPVEKWFVDQKAGYKHAIANGDGRLLAFKSYGTPLKIDLVDGKGRKTPQNNTIIHD